jgi:hypothetical protein
MAHPARIDGSFLAGETERTTHLQELREKVQASGAVSKSIIASSPLDSHRERGKEGPSFISLLTSLIAL